MQKRRVDRRQFVRSLAGSAAAVSALPRRSAASTKAGYGTPIARQTRPKIRFSVIGINHGHINSQVQAVQRGGGELVAVFAKEQDLRDAFVKRFPQAKVAKSADEIYDDKSIQLIVSAAIPDERAPIGIRAMRAGKDYMSDKPGITTLDQLAEARKVQAETRRIYSIMYSERFENRATVRAGELVKAGAIGQVVQTIGLGPHRTNLSTRPPWFFERPRYGGILCDIASHQADQFLYFTGSTSASVVASQVGNIHHPKYPGLEDFGDMMVRGDRGTGYIRVDWFTPDGLATWGDGRLTILGTDGFIEIRKNVDIGGKGLGSHLFLVDKKETKYVDCTDVQLLYGDQLVADVVNRTETAMTQAHCFLATELVLKAQHQAQRVAFKS
ncbi:MAG TPA: Gfo/Idh/MocA family oxidoreductase [Vicinamibacterales bacterium]|jgi:predicted dehydrogenase